MARTSYKTFLRGVGRKPLPLAAIARPEKLPGHLVLVRVDQPAVVIAEVQ